MEKTYKDGVRYYKKDNNLYPSVTSILQCYPKGEGFYRWLANVGYDKSKEIKQSAGKSGSRVHDVIENLLNKQDVNIDNLSDKEREMFNTFVDWFNKLNEEHDVEIIATELPIYNDIHKYAGTVDLILKVDTEYWIVDIKTSNYIHDTYELQLSAYAHSSWTKEQIVPRLFVFHIKEHGLVEVKDNLDVFLAVKRVFDYMNK